MSYLAQVPLVTTDAAYRAMILLSEGESDPAMTFEERRVWLIERGIVSPRWDHAADRLISQGSVAAMAARIMGIRGGVNRIVFGAVGLGDRRYANRDLIYLNMLPPSADYGPIRGGVLVALMHKAETYMSEHNRFEGEEEIELGTEEEALEGRIIDAPPPATQPGG